MANGTVHHAVRRGEGVGAWIGLDELEPRQLLTFDPTPGEQHLLELTNRFRINPARELSLLTTSLGTPARSSDPNVDSALRFFNTSGPTLQSQWASLTAAPPLAWNENLYNAAAFHSQAMIDADVQEHQVPGEPGLGERATNAGYTSWATLGESIFAFARSVIHTHAGFLLDWGAGATGIQDPPGHRNSAINSQFRETGIRILEPGMRPGKQTGPWVVTQDFGRRFTQTNAYVLGVAFGDSNADGFYDAGEGLGGVSVIVDGTGGRFQTSTMSAGGWQVSAPPGTYNVTFSGAGFGAAVTYVGVEVGAANAKVDGIRGVRPPTPMIEVRGNGAVIAPGDVTPTIQDFTGFGLLNRDLQSIERTFVVKNSGTLALSLSGLTRVVISGAGAADFALTQDLPASIAPGATAEFRVRFDPSAVGVRAARVTITSNDPTTPSHQFAIQGRGVLRPIAEVRGNGLLIASGDATPSAPDGTAVGAVNFPGGARIKTYLISNAGLADMTISASIVGVLGSESDAAAFSIVSLSGTTIPPGGSAELRVRYVPTRAGAQPAIVRVATSDPTNANYEFTLRGSGRAVGRLGVFAGGQQIPAGSTQTHTVNRTNFEAVTVTGGLRTRAFAIRNIGQAILNLTGTPRVVISGPNASAFSVFSQPALGAVAIGENTTFRVRFDAEFFGSHHATITILSDDPLVRSYSFAISGEGVR